MHAPQVVEADNTQHGTHGRIALASEPTAALDWALEVDVQALAKMPWSSHAMSSDDLLGVPPVAAILAAQAFAHQASVIDPSAVVAALTGLAVKLQVAV